MANNIKMFCVYCKGNSHKKSEKTANNQTLVTCPNSPFYKRLFRSEEEFKKHINISKVCQLLWKVAVNKKLKQGKNFKITPKGKKLFQRVDQSSLTTSEFKELENVVELFDGDFPAKENRYSRKERDRLYTFLDVMLSTDVGKLCLETLKQKGHFRGSRQMFEDKLFQIWFFLHQQDDGKFSCAFKHIFAGEIQYDNDGGHTVGLHNWTRYYREQQAGHIKYNGLFYNEDDAENNDVLTISFDWYGKNKPKGSMFIGTTPAFEFALYTYLYFAGDHHAPNSLKLEGQFVDVIVDCDGDRLVTAYPEELDDD